MQHLWYY